MGAGLIGFILGLLVGALTGTELGAITGGLTGLLIGLSVHAFGWLRSHLGDAPAVRRHLVMCTVFGQTADCDFVGDTGTGRWFDVTRCSLLSSPTQVNCDKGCIDLIRAGHVRPGEACNCELSGQNPDR